mmetsp:Transcript_52845/g.86285  ORF Transcript_52845/g.86285 Transcript_52845/m.86285 type:complete len:412 (-) Transcript_52845:211-1446(-)
MGAPFVSPGPAPGWRRWRWRPAGQRWHPCLTGRRRGCLCWCLGRRDPGSILATSVRNQLVFGSAKRRGGVAGKLLVVPLHNLIIHQADAIQLVPTGDPILMDVVWPTEEFQLGTIGKHALDQIVDLVRLPGGFAHLTHDHITVQIPVELWVAFDANQTVFLRVIDPVSSASCPDDALQLIGLHPDDLFNPFVSPEFEALPRQLHSTASDPEEDHPVLMDVSHVQILHLLVRQGAIGQLHMNIPGRVRHHDADETFEDGQGEGSQVAMNPLRWEVDTFHHQLVDALGVGASIVNTTFLQIPGLLQGEVQRIVNVLAFLNVPASIQVRAISQRLVGPGFDDLAEVDLGTGRHEAASGSAVVAAAVCAELRHALTLIHEFLCSEALPRRRLGEKLSKLVALIDQLTLSSSRGLE